MKFDFKGFDEKVLTFKAGDNTQKGMPVTLSNDKTVVPASSNGDFIGICTGVADGVATVQVKGYVEVGYVDNLTYNHVPVAADGNGKIKQYGSSKYVATVIYIDNTNHIAGIIL